MMATLPSPTESLAQRLDDFITQASNSPGLSRSSSRELPTSVDSSDTPTSVSTSSAPSLVQGRPRRKPIPRKGHTKSRRGCFNCKRRRVKCQETSPSCDNCYRLGLQCEYPHDYEVELAVPTPPKPSQPLSQSQLSMTDLHFFHHFLLHAYPGLPIQGESVWREVAQYSHGFDFLAHAMLALGASHLSLCNGTDYSSNAISHRVIAIKSLNSALDSPCQSKEEGDARYATLMALTFQSAYMTDGMQEFLSMLRGCSIVADNSRFLFEESAFRMFSTEGHVQRVVDLNTGYDTGLSDNDAIETGLASLRGIAPLSQSVMELSFIGKLQRILQISRTSCVGAFSDVCRAYQLFSEASVADFQTLSDPKNHIAQIIISHFFAVEFVLASIALAPVAPSFPFRQSIVEMWIKGVSKQAPARLRPHVRWPLEFLSRASGDWGLKAERQGILSS